MSISELKRVVVTGLDAITPISNTVNDYWNNLLEGHSGIEAIVTVMALAVASDLIPPIINLFNPDPECDLDYVPHHSRSQNFEIAISNLYVFGGHNVTLVF